MFGFYELLQQINQTQGAGHWNLWSTAPKLGWQLGLGDWHLKCGGDGQVLHDLALHLCDLMLSPGRQCQDGGAWQCRKAPYTFTHTHTHVRIGYRTPSDTQMIEGGCLAFLRDGWSDKGGRRKTTNIYWLANTMLSNFRFAILTKNIFKMLIGQL